MSVEEREVLILTTKFPFRPPVAVRAVQFKAS